MTTAAELIGAVRELLDAAPATAPSEFVARAERLRSQLEEAALGAEDPEALGFLTDAVVSAVLYARAVEKRDRRKAEECLEQAGLFSEAARQAMTQ